MERSIEMVISILGILKAGGAYVPVDPEFPLERINFILEDIRAEIILTTSKFVSNLQVEKGIEIIDINDKELLDAQSGDNLSVNIKGHHLAYIIYTSGSTGKPKGVMIQHASLLNYLVNSKTNYVDDESKNSGSFIHLSYAFDASVTGLLMPLLSGKSIVISSKQFVEVFEDDNLLKYAPYDFIKITPSHFQLLQGIMKLNDGRLLTRKLVVGGEALLHSHFDFFIDNNIDIEIINEYGPTEATVGCTTYSVHTLDYREKIKNEIPVGKPIDNAQIFILNEMLELVPAGITGEMYIGGDGLAKGYLNRDDLTEEKFIANPLRIGGPSITTASERLYKTGDLARWLPDGNIEYQGRVDDQVKIRGYRIELGEIESVLLQSGLLKQGVVLAKKDNEGNKRLVGYITSEGTFDKQAVIAYLQSHLPEYMVPVLWVQLESLPVTINGKVDKKALPEPGAMEIATTPYLAPRNKLEATLAKVYQDLLNVEQVGIDNNFFEMGGDSIMTIQIVSRVRREGYTLKPKDIYTHQTIAKLSAAITDRAGIDIASEQGPLQGESGLLPIQQWYFEKETGNISLYNQHVLLEINKSINAAQLGKAVEQLLSRHDALRLKYSQKNNQWKQQYGDMPAAFFIEDFRETTKDSLAGAISQKAEQHQSNLNIENGELVRMVLIKTPPCEANNRLLIAIHHLAVDGVSWRILLEDLGLILDAFAEGRQAELGLKSSSYREWFNALRNYGESHGLLSQKEYWNKIVTSYSPFSWDEEFDGKLKVKDTAHKKVQLGPEQTSRLLKEVPRIYHTEINDILLAGLSRTLCEWSKRDQVIIGLEGHGREDIDEGVDISRTLGWFTNLYPVKLDGNTKTPEGDLIKIVKEQLRQVKDKGMGYGVLKYINKEESLQDVEPWDIVFNYLGQLDSAVRESKWIKEAGEFAGKGISEDLEVNEKLSLNCFIQNGELVFNWRYSTLHLHEETVKELASNYIANIELLIAHSLQHEILNGVEYTPSDFGLASAITNQELDAFLEEQLPDGRIRKNCIDGLYRLSGLQQGMLFHGLYDAEAGIYIDQFGCDLVNLDLAHFKASWNYVIQGHSILRSAFYHDTFSIPVQCAYRNVTLPIEILDYRSMSDAEQFLAIKKFEESDRVKGFDFKVAPLMRLALIRLTDDRYRMLWSWHHLLLDGWSKPLLMEQFLNAYELLASGKELQVIEDDRYEDFIRYIEKINKQKEEKYWRNYMQGVEQSTLLPFIGKTAERTKGVGESKALYLEFDESITEKIQDYSRQYRVTANTIMQAVWASLLNRYTGNDEIVFGVIVSGRPDDLPQVEQRVGMYINTMPFHTGIKMERKITEWLNEIQEQQLASRQFQHTPFNNIQSWTGVPGDLFDSILVFENFPFSKVITAHAWKLQVENIYKHEQNNLPLTITVSAAGKISIEFRYNTGLLDEEHIKEIIGHFEEAIHQLLNNPQGRIADIDILPSKEQHQLLVEFNAAQISYQHNKTIVDLFEEQVEKTPDATAVVFEGEQLSFHQLNERANQLAHYLKSKGVKTETLVPLFIERGLNMMVGILGILKAGGAYVPIDTDFPQERISYMLEDTGAALLVTSEESRFKLQLEKEVEIIDIEADWNLNSPYSKENVRTGISSQNLAYVIYTSGSTGNPKGVMIEHRNLGDYVAGLKQKTRIDKCKSFALVSTIATDLGNTVIYASLLSGGALHIFSKDSVSDTQKLHSYFSQNRIDCLKIVPSHWKALCMEDQLLMPERLLVFGGEALQARLVEDISLSGTNCTIVNHYGPTETTIGKLLHIVDYNRSYGHTIPIGKAFSNTQVYVLSKDLKLCPVGVSGQLYISGEGVARGYYNNSALTNDKFIPDPFIKKPTSRMYGTGDLVKYLPDGNIEFIGRVDNQVKIRGYRIELGEIESMLQQYENVSDAVVLAKEDSQGNKRLVAYVVADGFNRQEIISYLQEKIPDYMIPSAIVEMEKLPLTANGKVDRKALPDPDSAAGVSDEYVAPGNEMERKLTEIWQDVLDLERVGVHDNFFELGGDSIISIQVVSRARRAGYELQVGDVFTYQTIASLVEYFMNRQESVAEVSSEQLLLSGPSGLLPVQQWYFEKEPAEISHFNQSVLLTVDKSIPETILKTAVEKLISQHDALRFSYHKHDGVWQQEYGSFINGLIAIDLSAATQNSFPSFLNDHTEAIHQSLDIEKGLLIKIALISTPDFESHNRLLIVIHHLAVDGVSWRILLEDLDILLTQLKNGESVSIGKKSSSYREWYDVLQNYGQSDALISQTKYWEDVVKSYHPLPVDKEYNKPVKEKDKGLQVIKLEADKTRQLLQDIPRVYHTEINDILLSALAKTISDWTNNKKVLIGLEGHGREAIAGGIDTSRTVGWFTTHYPVLLETDSAETESDLIKSVKEQLRQVPEKGIGYGILKYINNNKTFDGTQPWDIIFNYLGRLDNVVNKSKWLAVAGESSGTNTSEQYTVTEKMWVNGFVREEELVLNWTYSRQHYDDETVQQLTADYLTNLQSLIAHCIERQASKEVNYTPSDFGLGAEITYDELDNFLNEPFNGKARKESLESIYRLSGLQQGMLFHALYDEAEDGYINHFSCDLIDPDVGALEACWNYLVQSHTILRSAFYHDRFSFPVQCVYKEHRLSLEILDYSNKGSADRDEAVKQLQEADRRSGFDFEAGLLMRIYLIRLSDKRHRMLWSSHHILFDGWSRAILMEEFLKIYEQLISGKKLPVITEDRYEDYINFLDKIDHQKEKQHWQNYLQNVEQSTLLPFVSTISERTKGQGSFGSLFFQVNRESTARIESFAQQHRITMNTIMQGVWSYLLHRYTGNKNIVFGVIVSGRPDELPGIEKRVGLFINTLPLHSEIKEDQGISDWLQDIQKDQVTSRKFQFTPLQEIQQLTGVQGDLFDSLFIFENYPVGKILAGKQWKLAVENLQVDEQTNYPLNIVISSGEQINVEFIYNADLIRDEYIQGLKNQFEHVLLQIIEREQGILREISLIDKASEFKLLKEFNNNIVEYPKDKTLISLFEEQVEKTPGCIAVEFENEKYTYQELNKLANQLGHYLREKGIKEETLVPICLERSLEMIAGILGILKAGAAYVPIDPEYPDERIGYMLNDTGASIALGTKATSGRLLQTKGVQIIDLDEWMTTIKAYPDTNVENDLSPNNLAYVIYTSGSTGTPKGVMNEHGGVVNRLLWAQDYFDLTDKDSVLQKTTFCFDVSVWELFWPLLAGSKLVFARPGGHKDSDYLKEVIEKSNITMLHFVPSMLGVFLADLQPGKCSGLKKVLCSGEALKQSQVELFIEKLPGAELHNLYGPTEAAIDVTCWSLPEDIKNITVVPIGKPVANTPIYILNGDNGLVPLGGIGEVCIGGIQVARGYLNRPELTAEKFVDNPFIENSGAKMYRTGDLGRWLPDGNIEYLGRIDEQVKIRGFRIELGEIEACISSLPEIKNTKVTVTEKDPLIGKQLNAYIEIDKERLPLLHNYLHLLNNGRIQRTDLNILPNGLPVLSPNGNEVKFLYNEIFKEASYLRHGITLSPDSCVFDIGANVGFFTIFLNILSENIKVYSFEPIPEVYDFLVANRELYNIKGKAFQVALLDKEQEIEFEYYPQMTILSGIGEDKKNVKEVVRSYVESSEDEILGEAEMNALLEMKLESRKVNCKTKTLSQIISGEKIERIDLLKVDVENSEHLVLDGLADQDWTKIENIIIEVHDVHGRLEKITGMLKEKGFDAHVEKENLLSKDDILYNIYALRKRLEKGLDALGNNEETRKKSWKEPQNVVREITGDIEKRLPDYMVPSSIVLMDQLPLTPNGKIDKKALPDPETNESGKSEYEAPGTEIEKVLVKIWQDLLKKERIGIHDNFFELGGHSLLAMRVISAVRRELQKEMVIKILFVNPTVKELARYVEGQSKDSLLPSITAQPRPEFIPLSFSQERLWFIDKLEGSLQYHLPSILRLKGNLDKDTLTKAIQNIINRHEVLRTVILEDHGKSHQSVREKNEWKLAEVDGENFKNSNQDLQHYIRSIIKLPFNLSCDSLLRATLIRLSDQEHILVVTMHHIASDAWSVSIIVKELSELYAARIEKRPVVLSPLKIQYADYAIWQRNYLQGEVLDRKLAYWKNRLHGVPALQLPTDFPRPAVQSTNGARTRFTIDKELSEKLKRLSQREGATVFMVLLSAFKIMLQRYSGQNDICVGTPVANRTQQEAEELIGFFINTLALRSDLENNPSFVELLQKIKATTLEAYSHQEAPFEKVVEAVGNERDRGRNPLFQVLLTMQNAPEIPELRLGEISFTAEEYEHTTSQLDIICNITETPEGMQGAVEYCTDLFTENTITQMMAHFRQLLRSIADAPHKRISSLKMLNHEEENQLLIEFNNPRVLKPKQQTIVTSFESQVNKTPGNTAVVFEQRKLNYQELNDQANQLACYLQKLGVKAEQPVAICIERSLAMMVAILGILKSGAAYVPIDPSYPAERINYLLEDCGAGIVITNSDCESKLPNDPSVRLVLLDQNHESISRQNIENLQTDIADHQLAYIIYTSGSTGNPKGVMIEHRNLVSYLLNNKTRYINEKSENTSGSFIHLSYTFDASLTGMFMPLLFGKSVVIASGQSLEVFEDNNLHKYAPYDFIKITPSHLELLQPKMKTPDKKLLTKTLVLGGEALLQSQFNYLSEEGINITIINEYGPTEATVGCSVYSFDTISDKNESAGNRANNNSISIGKPIDNVQIHISRRQQ